MYSLKELMNNPYEFKVIGEPHFGEFTTDQGVKYELRFDYLAPGEYDLVFYSLNDDYEEDYSITGSGDEFRVLATIKGIVSEILNRNHEIEKFQFSAKEDSRRSLYQIFAKMISKETNFNLKSSYIDTSLNTLVFQFISKNLEEVKGDHMKQEKGRVPKALKLTKDYFVEGQILKAGTDILIQETELFSIEDLLDRTFVSRLKRDGQFIYVIDTKEGVAGLRLTVENGRIIDRDQSDPSEVLRLLKLRLTDQDIPLLDKNLPSWTESTKVQEARSL